MEKSDLHMSITFSKSKLLLLFKCVLLSIVESSRVNVNNIKTISLEENANFSQPFTEVEVASGGYLPSREAAR